VKIIVTGATGFIGGRVAHQLLIQGHEVSAIVRGQSDVTLLQNLGIERHVYDGTLTSLIQALEVSQATQVVNIASLYLAQHRPEDICRLVEANILFPTNLLEAMKHAGVCKLVNVGTSWQHFEDARYDPANLYAATKQAFEDLLAYYVSACGFGAITLKLFDTYGPGDARPKLLSLLRRTAKARTSLKMSPGKQKIDLVYIDDVLDAFTLASARLEKVTGAETYGVFSGFPISLSELVSLYEKVTGFDVGVEWGCLPYRPREIMAPWKNVLAMPGWSAKVPLAEGIRRMEEDASIGGLLSGRSS
jgi:nucleoside-diphosphate-sugar epimerase